MNAYMYMVWHVSEDLIADSEGCSARYSADGQWRIGRCKDGKMSGLTTESTAPYWVPEHLADKWNGCFNQLEAIEFVNMKTSVDGGSDGFSDKGDDGYDIR